MKFYEDKLYLEDLTFICKLKIPWEKLRNQSMLISGAAGMIGSFLIDAIMTKNKSGLNCKIYAIGRDQERAKRRFYKWRYDKNFKFIKHDVNESMENLEFVYADYVLHLASTTHPVAYALRPIETIMTNVTGTKNMLDFTVNCQAKRMIFASSNEIYGENRGDTETFDEKYCGYIDCNTLRAGYPESKRCGEALCQAYIAQKGIDAVIPRFTRSYGATMLETDTKALSQFIKRGLAKEDIILKSSGTQYYSYTYVADAVAGLLTVLLCGEKGAAYNIADKNSDIMLKDLAAMVADICGTQVIFDKPDETEIRGYSRATKARLDETKLKELGYHAHYPIKSGIERTIKILRYPRGTP
ncbi:NAD-dependent epimerase/dehydratase family protein [Mediterraneibacter sp. NSJ-55]|uniref:NAD-dependent epimerase/dehydratase family protein n=2 Tax=Mediterraneibacter hominis TaxID=2763054 RepID=A0A923RQS0_9FIRM|nr:NAD-dependent epimerase/dehydratase family protein [Mediterraneibacter hominis]